MSEHTLLYQKVIGLIPVSSEDWHLFFDAAELVQVKKGTILLNENAACRFIYFIENGFVRLFETIHGLEISTAFAFEGGFATSLKSLRSGEPSTITIQAAEDMTVYRFAKENLLSLYNQSRAIESLGRLIIEQVMIALEEHSALFKLYTPADRYWQVLKTQPHLVQRVKLTHLASYLGMVRETLSRIRAKQPRTL